MLAGASFDFVDFFVEGDKVKWVGKQDNAHGEFSTSSVYIVDSCEKGWVKLKNLHPLVTPIQEAFVLVDDNENILYWDHYERWNKIYPYPSRSRESLER